MFLFKLNTLKIRRMMKEKNLTPQHLTAAGIYPQMVTDIAEGKDIKSLSFEPLLNLGKVLGTSPYSLILNQIAF